MEVHTKWRWLMAGWVAAVLVCAAYFMSGEEFIAAANKEKNPAPQVSLDKDLYDFGAVRRGVILHHRFRIRNTGKQELTLSRNGGIDLIRIPPGDVKEVQFTFHTARRWGRSRKSIHYTTNDPEHPELKLSVTALIRD